MELIYRDNRSCNYRLGCEETAAHHIVFSFIC